MHARIYIYTLCVCVCMRVCVYAEYSTGNMRSMTVALSFEKFHVNALHVHKFMYYMRTFMHTFMLIHITCFALQAYIHALPAYIHAHIHMA